MGHQPITEQMRDCIAECSSCHEICTETITHCLALGGDHAEVDHISTLIDCAALCRESAEFMLRGSRLHHNVCGVCAEACDRCAVSCEAMPEDDLMRRCADECRRCADSCRRMAAAETSGRV